MPGYGYSPMTGSSAPSTGGFNWGSLLGLGTGNPLAALPLFGSLLGLFGGGHNPQREFERNMQRYRGLLPQETSNLYRAYLNSPAFSQAQGALAQGNLGLRNQLASSLGARGLERSGVGAIAGPLAASQLGGGMANLYSSLWASAAEEAQQSLKTRLGLAGELLPKGAGGGYFQFGSRERLQALIDMLSKLPLMYGNQQPRG